jgi:hypothetical protein
MEEYESILRLHIVPDLGRLILSDVTPQHIKAYETKKLKTLCPTTTIGTSVWVYLDARDECRQHELPLKTAILWSLSCFLIWLIAFPYYLCKRGHLEVEHTNWRWIAVIGVVLGLMTIGAIGLCMWFDRM